MKKEDFGSQYRTIMGNSIMAKFLGTIKEQKTSLHDEDHHKRVVRRVFFIPKHSPINHLVVKSNYGRNLTSMENEILLFCGFQEGL